MIIKNKSYLSSVCFHCVTIVKVITKWSYLSSDEISSFMLFWIISEKSREANDARDLHATSALYCVGSGVGNLPDVLPLTSCLMI